MNTPKPIQLLLALALVSLMGCATTTRRSTSERELDEITGAKLDNRDCAKAAGILVSRLIESGKLAKLEHPTNEPALLIVSRIVNSTGQHLDMDMVTGRITIALDDTGKVQTVATDGTANGIADLKDFLKDRKVTQQPDYTLSGKIIQDSVRQGNKTLNTYIFQLSLNSTSRRIKLWQDEEKINKLTNRPGLGL